MEKENQFMVQIKGFYYFNVCVFWKDFLYEAKMTYDKSEEKSWHRHRLGMKQD